MAESSATCRQGGDTSAVASAVETQSSARWSRPQFQSGVASPMHVDVSPYVQKTEGTARPVPAMWMTRQFGCPFGTGLVLSSARCLNFNCLKPVDCNRTGN